MNISFVQKLIDRMRREGSIVLKPGCGHISRWQQQHHEALQVLVKEYPDATLAEYQKLFLEKAGMVTRTPTLCCKLKGLKYTYKKNINFHLT